MEINWPVLSCLRHHPGVLLHDPKAKKALPGPKYSPPNYWSKQRATVGQNNYIGECNDPLLSCKRYWLTESFRFSASRTLSVVELAEMVIHL